MQASYMEQELQCETSVKFSFFLQKLKSMNLLLYKFKCEKLIQRCIKYILSAAYASNISLLS